MSMDFDFSELDSLAADIGEAPRKAQKNIRQAMEVTARNVKNSWKSKVTGARFLRDLSPTVSYDITSGSDGVEAEVGFDRGRGQGKLGAVSEFGTPSSAPRLYGLAALEENQEDFMTGLGIAIEDAL